MLPGLRGGAPFICTFVCTACLCVCVRMRLWECAHLAGVLASPLHSQGQPLLVTLDSVSMSHCMCHGGASGEAVLRDNGQARERGPGQVREEVRAQSLHPGRCSVGSQCRGPLTSRGGGESGRRSYSHACTCQGSGLTLSQSLWEVGHACSGSWCTRW